MTQHLFRYLAIAVLVPFALVLAGCSSPSMNVYDVTVNEKRFYPAVWDRVPQLNGKNCISFYFGDEIKTFCDVQEVSVSLWGTVDEWRSQQAIQSGIDKFTMESATVAPPGWEGPEFPPQ